MTQDVPPARTEQAEERVPRAIVEHAPKQSRWSLLVWLVPVAAIGLSLYFVLGTSRARGPAITVFAEHGYGVGPGDAVRYLGIEVGRVETVVLSAEEGVGEVQLGLRLTKDAAGLAREGTRFWIVRPELSLDSVAGLDTIIGAQYIAVAPGPSGGARRDRFTALGEMPLEDEIDGERGVEIVLEASTRHGLQVGAPLTYRGVRIGTVTAVGLASDATRVEVRARVRGAFTQLVRGKSVFWETGGFELDLSLTGGLEIDLDSLRTAFVGGVAMATPLDAGPPVSNGARFALADDVTPEWLTWTPALPLGNALLPPDVPMPRLIRATLEWREGRILKSDESREGWLHVKADGLLGPADLLSIPDDAREGRATLEVAGRSFDLGDIIGRGLIQDAPGAPGVLQRLAPEAFESGWDRLLEETPGSGEPALRTLTAPEDLLLVREAGRDPIGVDATRVRVDESGVVIDDLIPVTLDWHGAAALARSDGALVGLVVVAPKRPARIVAP